MLACIFIENFVLDVTIRWHLPGHASAEPSQVIVIDGSQRPAKVLTYSPMLREMGIQGGMAEREARALCPEAAVLLWDEDAITDAYRELVQRLRSLVPKLEAAQPGLVYLDLGEWHRPEERDGFVCEIQNTLDREMGYASRVGLAHNRFVAFVAARTAPPDAILSVESGQEAAFLSDQSVHRLPIQRESIRRLQLLGLTTLGQIAALPIQDLIHQFGKEGLLMADLARGIDPTPLTLYRPPDRLECAVDFEPPLAHRDQILAAAEPLVAELFQQYEASCRRYTHLILQFHFQHHEPSVFRAPLTPRLYDVKDLAYLACSKIATLTWPAPIVGMEIHIDASEWGSPLDDLYHQSDFWEAPRERRRLYLNQWIAQPRWEDHTLMRAVEDDVLARIPEWRAHLDEWQREVRAGECYQPVPVEVKLDRDALPAGVCTETGWHRIQTLHESWEVEDTWWTEQPIHRRYFLASLINGTVLHLFQDRRDGGWYQQ